VLEPLGSAALRDKLIAELKELNSADEAAAWAHRMMRSKDSLMRKDAEQLEPGFQLKLSTFTTARPKAPDLVYRMSVSDQNATLALARRLY
jgi:hypothetical protein